MSTAPAPAFDVVIPTIGRESLIPLLEALGDDTSRPPPHRIIVVDDRPGAPTQRLEARLPGSLHEAVEVLRGPGCGPAGARNAGWRAADCPWVAFLDDDVLPPPGWSGALARDLAELSDDVAGSQGRIRVPLPDGRPPTDWERNVAGLERARWATADMAYRRRALMELGGFDEGFPRAYREDAELALRALDHGHRLVLGGRTVEHPVRAVDGLISLRQQRGNADDVRMWFLQGSGWRHRAGAPRGRFRRHALVTGAGVVALIAALLGRRRATVLAAVAWLGGTGELAWSRIAPGPRTNREVTTMVLTSALLPPLAVAHRLRGVARHLSRRHVKRPAAILLDRDGTIVLDVPHNADPGRVRAVPGAGRALDRARRAGVPLAVVSNQSGVARGLVSPEQLERVNARVEQLVGPFASWHVCPHDAAAGCGCRKPSPGMIFEAVDRLNVDSGRCVMIGDTGADVEAARSAGVRGILVPNGVTREEEIHRAAEVAPSLEAAIDLALGGRP